jgi:hypothetical protein
VEYCTNRRSLSCCDTALDRRRPHGETAHAHDRQRQRRNENDAPIHVFGALGRAAAMQIAALPGMIAVGVDAGYREANVHGAVSLTSTGVRWYLRDAERRE